MSENKNYEVIFKSTFLFAFVQAFNILIKVILNKVVAVTLGSNGIGIIGLFSAAVGMLKTGTSLGISQSAIRDISEINQKDDFISFSRVIITVKKLVIITALIGFVVTVLLSPLLSKWTFGNDNNITKFILLSFSVLFITLWEGQLAILKGLRKLRILAKSNIYGSLSGLILSVPIYLFFGDDGIVPVLILTPFLAFLFSNYYVSKINIIKTSLTIKEVIYKSFSMIKMGMVLSVTIFLSQASVFLISSYIATIGGLQAVGFYNAGTIIMVGYFSVVINALTTDYYPRIAAVNSDNIKIQTELNQQSIVSLLIAFPLIVLFLFLLPFLIVLFYSEEFNPIVGFVNVGIYGVLITIISNQVDLILVAKNSTKVYIMTSIFYRVIELIISMFLFKNYGLVGMGVSMVLAGIFHLAIMSFIVNKLYKIRFNSLFIKTALIALFLVLITTYLSLLDNQLVKYVSGFLMFVVSCFFSFFYSKKYLNFNLIKILSK